MTKSALLRILLPCIGISVISALTAAPAKADPPPPEMVDFLNSFEPRFAEMSRNPNLDLLGSLTGLWVADQDEDNPNIDLVHVVNVGPFLIEYVVDRQTGRLSSPTGYAERRGDGWAGWYSIGCRGCCPGRSWWDEGVASVMDRALVIRVDTVKLDPDSCEFTTTPDLVNFRSKLIDVFAFGEFLPGKLIHIVAAPAVGNQPAQYKAAVKLTWDFRGYGVTRVDLVANGPNGGSQVLQGSTDIAGETEFLTDRAGTYRFILAGYNIEGNPLHFEIESIEIPRVPGIN